MRDLLFLAHRIPYPPNKGDKIRSWHILRHLAERYRVHLGCFVDDPADRQYETLVRRHCADCCLVDLAPRSARLRSARAFLTGEPLTLPYYYDRRLADWVRDIIPRRRIERIFIFSAAMAQYVELVRAPSIRTIADIVDVDSEKWRDYARRNSWPARWVYGREARTLLRVERAVAAHADASLFVSAAEADLFRQLAPEVATRVHWVGNGVDCDFFSPDRRYENPFGDGGPTIVFTGAMDYWPNVDAVTYFATAVLPLIQAVRRDIRFYIVGASPTADVEALGRIPGVQAVGRVADMRPYLAHADVAVAPLRVARGVQNKVLEAMAMARPTVVTPQALEGIGAEPDRHLLLARDAPTIAAAVVRALSDPRAAEIGQAARQYVLHSHAWRAHLEKLDQLLEGDSA